MYIVHALFATVPGEGNRMTFITTLTPTRAALHQVKYGDIHVGSASLVLCTAETATNAYDVKDLVFTEPFNNQQIKVESFPYFNV